VIDANNYYPTPDRPVPELDADETTSSELLASLLPGATVVKAFNTIYFGRLHDQSRPDLPAEQRLAGTLAETRRQQPGAPLYEAFAESRRDGVPLTAPRLRELLDAS
jgi:hypothetical protein